MKFKKISILGLGALAAFSLIGCGNHGTEKEDVSIVYTNDIHSYIGNTVTNSNKEVEPGFRLSNVAQMVNDMTRDGKNVMLVDDGDEVQGDVYGSIDRGESVIGIMNACGYELASPGNHDFDYGMLQFNKNVGIANFPYISCNFKSITKNKNVLDSTFIKEIGGVKIAFVGVTTPETITSSTPKYFQDDSGKYIYSFDGQADKEDLYESVQNAIDSVRGKADYIIGLGHLGVGIDEERLGIRSIDVINNTTGFDAFIDGHSHTVMESEKIKRKDGKEIILTQTGCYMQAVGVMTITKDGDISTKLVKEYSSSNKAIAAMENALITKVDNDLGQKIGVLDNKMYVNNPEKESQRIVRARETNLGDFAADATYWYFNENKNLNCDVAIANGGGIRADLESGDLTYKSVKTVEPFGNMICMIEATGQNIKDALEMGATVIGTYDAQWDAPAENGGFLQVAGMEYSIDASITTSVTTNSSGMFTGVTGDYKVKDIKIYNKTTNTYEPIDLTKTYTIAGVNYILRNNGNGCSMFSPCKAVVDFTDLDYMILAAYVQSFTKGEDGYSHINTNNSPLNDYANYMINYENGLGSGRINILNLAN